MTSEDVRKAAVIIADKIRTNGHLQNPDSTSETAGDTAWTRRSCVVYNSGLDNFTLKIQQEVIDEIITVAKLKVADSGTHVPGTRDARRHRVVRWNDRAKTETVLRVLDAIANG